MAEITRIIKPLDEKVAAHGHALLPLSFKLAVVLTFTIYTPVVIAILLHENWLPGLVPLEVFLASSARIGSLMVPMYDISMVLLALGILLISYSVLSSILVHPVMILSNWVSSARKTDFAHPPILPELHAADEIRVLGRDISALIAQLSEITEQDRRLTGEKALFMTIASHQLRTPLTGLLWSVDALLSPSTPEESKVELMQGLNTMLKRLRLVVNHMLASANIESGKYGYVIVPTDIVVVIQSLIEEFVQLAEDRGVSMSFEHPATVPQVYADGERIALALFDLITNALDYTPRGGKIVISCTLARDQVEIAVADTGIGISAKDLPLLFTKFYRGDNAKNMRPSGSGLGLFLVKNIITSHNSEITVTSNEHGGGSRFSFFLSTKKVG